MKASKIQTGRKNLNERVKELKYGNEHTFNWYSLDKMIKSDKRLSEQSKYNEVLKDWIKDISENPIRSREGWNMEAPENWYFRKTQKAGVWK
jgi:hypothetical protein